MRTWLPKLHEECRVPVLGGGVRAIVTAVPCEKHTRTFRVAASDGHIHDVLTEDLCRLSMTDDEAKAYQARCLCQWDQDSRHYDGCPIHNRFHADAQKDLPRFYRENYAYENWEQDRQAAAARKTLADFRREAREQLPPLYDPDAVADAMVWFAQKLGKLPKVG